MEPSERSWGITPVPDRLRTLSLLDVGLLWGNLGVSLLVLFTGTFLAGLGLQRALLATVVGAVLGTALLGLAGLIGFERRVPRDGAHARPPRPPRLVRADRPERRAEPRLGGVRAVRDVARRERPHGPALRLRGALGLGAGLRRAHRLAGPGGADLVRAPVRAALRRLGGGGLSRLPRVVGARRRRHGRALVGFRRGRDHVLAGRRPHDRHGGVMAAARGRLHALLPQPARRVLGDVGRVLRPARAALRARRAPGALARAGGAERHLHRHRGRRSRQRAARCSRSRWTRPTSRSPTSTRRRSRSRTSSRGPPSGSSSCSSRATATLGAGVVDILAYETFLLLLGSFFVPLFGVLAADFLLGAGRPVDVRWSGIAAWAAGFALFQWIHPIGPAWWVDQAARIPGAGDATIGASLPAFALAFALYAGVRSAHAPLGRRRARLAGSR